MKIEKKLKRGLSELSSLFVAGPTSPTPFREGTSGILRSAHQYVGSDAARRSSPNRTFPDLVCVSFISMSPRFQTADLVRLVKRLEPSFEDVFFLAVDSTESHYQALADALPIPPWDQVIRGNGIHLRALGRQLHCGYVTLNKLRDLIHPSVKSEPIAPVDPKRKSLAILDFSHSTGTAQNRETYQGVLELLDDCVLVAEPNLTQLTDAYEWLRESLRKKPGLRSMLLLTGTEAESLWEFIYERFYRITSDFLAHDLGFLGWLENGSVELNADSLRESTSDDAVHCVAKGRLMKTLFGSQDPL